MRSTCTRFFILLLFLISAGDLYAGETFTWINLSGQPDLIAEVSRFFAAELRPDDPEEVRPYTPQLYKYIARIGVFRNSCLVLLGNRDKEEEDPESDLFRVYWYDRTSLKKGKVGSYRMLSLITEAFLEPSPSPDVFFKFYDCRDCEKTGYLSSFLFDAKRGIWKERFWPGVKHGLMIESDLQPGREMYEYDCLHKIADVNSDGFADIAIRCRETGDQTGVTKDELLLYTVRKGIPKWVEVRDKKKADELKRILCEGQSSPLCSEK